MDEKKEKSLVIKNDSFFDRLKIFFKMFFNFFYTTNEEEKNINTENNVVDKNLKNIEEIDQDHLTKEDYEKRLKDIVLELQEAYENGTIKEEDLSSDKKEELKKLYINQINSLKESIEKNETVILKLKEKIEIINDKK